MSTAVAHIDAWHKTKIGYALMAIVELAIAYMIGSRSIDTGSWWEYLLTIVLLIGGLQNLAQLTKLFIRKEHVKN